MNPSAAHAVPSSPHTSCIIAGRRVVDRRIVEVLPKAEHTTQRLVYRLLTPRDGQAFVDAISRSRETLRRWIPMNHEGERDDHFFHRTMTRARVQNIEGTAWRRAAFIDRGEHAGQFLGIFNLIKIQRGLEWSCEANWWIDCRFAGQGYASEGVQGMIDYALADHPLGLGMHLVRAHICRDNPASIRVAEKCGFSANGSRDLLEVNKALIHHDEFECWSRCTTNSSTAV